MNQSLDGYVDHMAFAPGPTLFLRFHRGGSGAGGLDGLEDIDKVVRTTDMPASR